MISGILSAFLYVSVLDVAMCAAFLVIKECYLLLHGQTFGLGNEKLLYVQRKRKESHIHVIKS